VKEWLYISIIGENTNYSRNFTQLIIVYHTVCTCRFLHLL